MPAAHCDQAALKLPKHVTFQNVQTRNIPYITAYLEMRVCLHVLAPPLEGAQQATVSLRRTLLFYLVVCVHVRNPNTGIPLARFCYCVKITLSSIQWRGLAVGM